jgi:hypothetical protein
MLDQGLMISTQVETVLTEFMERKKQYLSGFEYMINKIIPVLLMI